ncbi:thiamine phosphate synthase [Acetobacter sp.]|jgi:thiamine-phosphate pyrophosphorylase|uniref:thiamine phosphate synthase n=1 Tax=Acetobacter sp. TaxID=440 RepID=UPI0025C4EE65|nr:thiamine phosphate synthase [Acetobacter sp.]MCH4090312.1 thiamine phosphate synthase [Acetobacter sp.]MCI1299006.1 thiamine phosphate synthase [Acetobacter sp.]MCI1315026.1 thiamine phosphate synthase [Acetobacter sp.]
MSSKQPDTGRLVEPCEAYLVTPPLREASSFVGLLDHALTVLPVAAVRLRLADTSPGTMKQTILDIRQVMDRHDAALMLDGFPELVRETGCDGAHVGAEDVAAARKILGDSFQLGAACDFSRDLAMLAGEKGADYVAFGPFGAQPETDGLALLTWWREMMELPVVAAYSPASETAGLLPDETLRTLAGTADFLALGITGDGEGFDALWQTPEKFLPLFA